ncbi:PREDICTED: uncharacterized protein LOC108378329 [Rhagoletis zephyria]|uniref:uncharacterized protein LOC108378329 n=1 Tax=Rhagoletis zephyria TaxID=28612 RepID=UPI0008113580|nr:PREDICTED: uncharacterized protein LOC108378329 [Rhagoletis zephyria]
MSFTLESCKMQVGFHKNRTCNRLSMEERVMVIKLYKETPNYQRLANHFGCSFRQIKKIIANQDEIMHFHKNLRAKDLAEEVSNSRREKIDFLGKVVYEFLLRALYLRMPIDTAIIRQRAFEVKEAIAIESFTPNNAWLQAFRSHYNRLDLTAMVEQLPSDMEMRRSLKCIDIIEYVSKQEREKKEKTHMEADDSPGSGRNESEKAIQNFMKSENDFDDYEVYGSAEDDADLGNHESVENMSTANTNAASIFVDLDSEEEDEQAESAVVKTEETVSANTSSYATKPILKPSTPPPFPDIHSYPEAMRHLKVLEDFAMIEENYRAIGLITQLEQIFKNPPKLKS